MKKVLYILIASLLILSISACSKKAETKSESKVETSEETTVEELTIAETETATEQETAKEAKSLADGTRRVIVKPGSVTNNDDGTYTATCQLYELVVLSEEEVKGLKEGGKIKLSKYNGLSDIDIYSVFNKSQDVYEVNEVYMIEPNHELNGYTIRGLDDDMVRYETEIATVVCDENTQIEDEMGAIINGNSANGCKTIGEASEKYGIFDATITSEGGKAKHIIVHYHP